MRRLALFAILLTACSNPPIQSAGVHYDDNFPTTIATTIPTTTPTTQPRPVTTRPSRTAATVRSRVTGGVRVVSSTAYCLRGRMANGEQVHQGAVASKILPRGSRWLVLSGPLSGNVYTVKDTGPKAYFDVWMPSCPAAVAYGRRKIEIAPA